MDRISRLRFGALLIVGFATLLWIGVIAFAVGEAIGNHSYGWLVLVPLAVWGLRALIIGGSKVLRASPDDPRWPRPGDGPSL